MKKVLILTLSLALLFFGSSTLLAFGGSSCEVPKILKEGSSFLIVLSNGGDSIVKILEIDKKSCWIKVLRRHDDPSWINLKTVSVIQPQKN